MKPYKKLAVLAACAILSACGFDDGNEGLAVSTARVDVSGLLAGEQMQVSLGSEVLTVTENGVRAFSARVNIENGYTLNIVQSPVGRTCSFSNGLDRIDAYAARQAIFCGAGASGARPIGDSPFQIRGWTGATALPSLVVMTLGIVDLNGSPLTGATAEKFRFFNAAGNEIFSSAESPIHVDAVPLTNLTLRTALVLDISRSLSEEDIDTVKQAALLAVDGLRPFQQMSVFAFDSVVTQVAGYTNDPAVLTAAINAIPRDAFLRDSSTNLYGAVSAAAQSWVDEVFLDTADIGFAIVITDGQHTADQQTFSSISGDVAGKQLFAVAVGNAASLTALREITDDPTGSKGNVIQVSNVSGLAGAFSTITQRQIALASGLHIVYYVSPERDTGVSGGGSLTAQVRDLQSCLAAVDGAFCAYTLLYDTTGFTGNNGLILIPGAGSAVPDGTIDFVVPEWMSCGSLAPNIDWTLSVLQGGATGAVLDATSYQVTLGPVLPIEFQLVGQDLNTPGCSGSFSVLLEP
jgi:uncharacterized protein YegL